MRPGPRVSFLLAATLLAGSQPAVAWNETGHNLVARLAWQRLSGAARLQAVRLLAAAPSDSGLLDLREGPRGLAGAGFEPGAGWFVRSAYWPDLVRRDRPSYNRPAWHYVNIFLRRGVSGFEPTEGGPPPPENVMWAIAAQTEVLRSAADPGNRAVALAWLLHLVGDVHQPLHSCAEVSAEHPSGDRGGNDFKLEPMPAGTAAEFRGANLHGYWDSILDSARPRRWWENQARQLARLQREAEQSATKGSSAALGAGNNGLGESVERWVGESFELCRTVVYPGVAAEQAPGDEYRERAYRVALERVDLAAARLAALLEGALSSSASVE